MVLFALQFSAGEARERDRALHENRPPLFRRGERHGGMSSRHVIGKNINGASYRTFGSIREEENEQEAVGGQGAHLLFLSKIFLERETINQRASHAKCKGASRSSFVVLVMVSGARADRRRIGSEEGWCEKGD